VFLLFSEDGKSTKGPSCLTWVMDLSLDVCTVQDKEGGECGERVGEGSEVQQKVFNAF
jgi:hypothetical protein